MNWMEAALLILGIGAFVASFIIPEKKSKDTEKAQEIDTELIKKLIEKEMEAAKARVTEVVDETLDYAVEKTERAAERISNEKIMAISEYSETVLADMNKTHQEIMFLYDMLNDKHENLKETAKQVDKQAKEAEEKANAAATALAAKEEASALLEKQVQLTTQTVEAQKTEAVDFVPIESKPVERITLDKIFGENIPAEVVVPETVMMQNTPQETQESKNVEVYSFAAQAPRVERPVKKEAQAAKLEDSVQAMKQQEAESARKEITQKEKAVSEVAAQENNNDKILRMYKEGMSNVDIAKELGLGVGEVKLVINLFKGA